MTTGIILAILFLLTAGKIFYKRIQNPSFRRISMMIHKCLGVLMLIVAVIHLLTTWKLMKQRPFAMYITGIIMVLFVILELASFLLRSRLKKKWILLHRIGAVGILICLVIHVVLGFGSLNQYKEIISGIHVENINIAEIPDGTYVGECDAGYVYAKVEVTVKDGRMEDVKLLEHRTEKGKPAEVIPAQMVEQQKVDVDAVSGATNSSKVMEEAVCNALNQAKEN